MPVALSLFVLNYFVALGEYIFGVFVAFNRKANCLLLVTKEKP